VATTPQKTRWGLSIVGAVFLAQGIGKALEPTGYMLALDAFQVLRPGAHGPVKLGALALTWTVLELVAAVAMLHGGLARTPQKPAVLAGVMLALGLSCAGLVLDLGALARHLPATTPLAIAQQLAALALLTWLFFTNAPRRTEATAPRMDLG